MKLEVKLVVSFGISDTKGIKESPGQGMGDVNVLFHNLGADYMGNSPCEISLKCTYGIHTLFSICAILQ